MTGSTAAACTAQPSPASPYLARPNARNAARQDVPVTGIPRGSISTRLLNLACPAVTTVPALYPSTLASTSCQRHWHLPLSSQSNESLKTTLPDSSNSPSGNPFPEIYTNSSPIALLVFTRYPFYRCRHPTPSSNTPQTTNH